MSDWLTGRRTEVAADRILDAADDLFIRHDAATVGMNDIAAAAGCSRATVYRYFENREALHTAYVHREGRRVYRELGERLTGHTDPRERLTAGVLLSLRLVRESPALSSWFTSAQHPIGGQLAERSEVIATLTASFLGSLGVEDVERRARWLVRVIVSLLVFPGRDDADERAMLEEFVVPLVSPPQRAAAPGWLGATTTPAAPSPPA